MIAAQNERPGFVTLIGYIGLVYAFLGDFLIFSEVPNSLEIAGVSLILFNNIVVICQNMEPQEVVSKGEQKSPSAAYSD